LQILNLQHGSNINIFYIINIEQYDELLRFKLNHAYYYAPIYPLLRTVLTGSILINSKFGYRIINESWIHFWDYNYEIT